MTLLHKARRNRVRVFFVAALVVALAALGAAERGRTFAADYTTPITAAFFYPWFPETWHSNDHYQPALGTYSSDNPTIAAAHVAALRHAGMQAAITSWWGIGQHNEAVRFPILHQAAAAQGLGVIPYYEPEGMGDPSVAQIQTDLAYVEGYAIANPGSAVRIGGKPVIFVYNAGATSCADVTKWKEATAGFSTWYVNMKVFSGFRTCPDQPSSWHQYGPAVAEAIHLPYSFNISPGFWHHNEATPRLVRDPVRWATNVGHLRDSAAQWKLVTSFNEWGEATSIEPSPSWQSPSGWGTYIDELHQQLLGASAPSSPSPSASASPSASPSSSLSASPSSTPSPTPPHGPSITVMAAGDIAEQPPCNGYVSGCQDGWTAALLSRYNPDAVLTLGDNQYESGTLAQYQAGWGRQTCAAPGQCDAWGLHTAAIYPAPGNHEWLTPNAQGYRDYFGPRLDAIRTGPGAGEPASGSQMYYSYDLGNWHFISLDSDCSQVGGCTAGRPMVVWLLADLAANNNRPTIVYHHHPRWSSGDHGSTSSLAYLHSLLLTDRDVQIALAGHDHEYERFAPMGSAGPDPAGIRYFVVGTGGKGNVCGGAPIPGTVVKNCATMGTLRLVLRPDGYDWQFIPVAEVGGPGTFTDAGTSQLRP